MEDTLRNAWLPSNPATDPETEDVPGTRLFPNNSLIHLLKHGEMLCTEQYRYMIYFDYD